MKTLDNNMDTTLTEFEHCLIVTLSDEMTDSMISDVMETVTKVVSGSDITGAILNFVKVKYMDQYAFDSYRSISKALMLMGIRSVWVGMKPSAVCALLDMDVDSDDESILTAVNLESGLSLLRGEK